MDRYRGVVLGLAVGNALGLPAEGRPAAWIRERYPRGLADIDPVETDRPWDDDVAQAVLLAEALVEEGRLDLEDLGRRLLAWYRESGRGIGLQTARVIEQLSRGTPAAYAAGLVWEASGRQAAGNGAVMRCAPVALRWWRDEERLIEQSRISARVTHEDPRCQWSCVALNLALAGALAEKPLDLADLARRLRDREAPGEVTEAIHASLEGDPANLRLDGWDMGYTLKAMQVGLWCLAQERDFEGALVQVVACGGDTDTNGAVAGAALGAAAGAGAIPERWLARISGTEHLRTLGARLGNLADGDWGRMTPHSNG